MALPALALSGNLTNEEEKEERCWKKQARVTLHALKYAAVERALRQQAEVKYALAERKEEKRSVCKSSANV